MSRSKPFLFMALLWGLLFSGPGCGGEPQDQKDQQQERADLELVGGKADFPFWLRHIPVNWGCDQTLSGQFRGFDSAHLYSFEGKVGYELTFTFNASYPSYRGAVIAVYDSETGERVAHVRNRWSNQATLTYRPEKSIKYLVAVYSVTFWATGSYTLSVDCEIIFITCQSDLSCTENQFCKFESGCGQSDLGVCTDRPDACTKHYAPVCGCDGKTYGNDCTAAQAGVSVDHAGECASDPPAGQCEAAGGYCTYFLDPCKVGYLDGEPMDCPMGKSGKCCLPAAVVTLDDTGYQAGEAIQATVTNNATFSVFLPGCSLFSWQKLVDGSWTDQGPDKVCFWEGFAVELKAEASLIEQLVAKSEGTWRLAVSYGVGCSPDLPLSQANCTASPTVYSDPVTIKDCPLLSMPNPSAFCPDGLMSPKLDPADGICIVGYDCTPCQVEDCGPQPGMPNHLCDDGQTLAGPTGSCIASGWGTCTWEIITCPGEE